MHNADSNCSQLLRITLVVIRIVLTRMGLPTPSVLQASSWITEMRRKTGTMWLKILPTTHLWEPSFLLGPHADSIFQCLKQLLASNLQHNCVIYHGKYLHQVFVCNGAGLVHQIRPAGHVCGHVEERAQGGGMWVTMSMTATAALL